MFVRFGDAVLESHRLCVWVEAREFMIKLQVGGQFLLARITRKSLKTMNLTIHDPIFTQIKGVALMTDYER